MVKLIDNKIQRAFSLSAEKYEHLSVLQQKVGNKLIRKFQEKKECENILDVGMGTGCLTNKIVELFPDSKVVGLDFAAGMVSCANSKYNNFEVVQADAGALPFKDNFFDIIFSNAAYQWVGDLEGAFKEAHCSLKKGGILSISMFGKKTLDELFESLGSSFITQEGRSVFSVGRLPDKGKVLRAMQGVGFKDIVISTEIVKMPFSDMYALLRWLKGIGANTNKRNAYIGKNRFARANAYYADKFKVEDGIYASFEIVWVSAVK